MYYILQLFILMDHFDGGFTKSFFCSFFGCSSSIIDQVLFCVIVSFILHGLQFLYDLMCLSMHMSMLISIG